MTVPEAHDALAQLHNAINVAATVLAQHRPVLDAYFVELQRVDSVMPIIDPTLWMNPERRDAERILTPMYRSVRAFLDAFETARSEFGEPKNAAD